MEKLIIILNEYILKPLFVLTGCDGPVSEDVAGANRQKQTVRGSVGTALAKTDIIDDSGSGPYSVGDLEIPGKNLTFGARMRSGKFTTDSLPGYIVNFSAYAVTVRYHISNTPFNIPADAAVYGVEIECTDPDNNQCLFDGEKYVSSAKYPLTSFSVGLGNEWASAAGAFFGIDWLKYTSITGPDANIYGERRRWISSTSLGEVRAGAGV